MGLDSLVWLRVETDKDVRIGFLIDNDASLVVSQVQFLFDHKNACEPKR